MKDKLYVYFKFVSAEPLVTLSRRTPDSPMGIAGVLPDYFESRDALHLIISTWTLENSGNVAVFANEIELLSSHLKRNSFLVLANTEYELYLLAQQGVQAILASSLIFVDDSLFYPTQRYHEQEYRYNAVYNARFEPFKRHELAIEIPKLLFIYDQQAPYSESYFNKIREAMPNACFSNHELSGGKYKHLSADEVRTLTNQCKVGLCLSAEEGAMRASIEYLLCGIPVVSTHSVGGRERYLIGEHCEVVFDASANIADAVDRLSKRDFEPQYIRSQICHLLEFDRYNFLLGLNKIANKIFGVNELFKSIKPFIGPVVYHTPDAIRAALSGVHSRASEAVGPVTGSG